MKVLLTLLKAIIAIYLVTILLLTAFFLTYKELYDNPFPLLFDYSYYKVETEEYTPDYEKNDFIIVKKSDEVSQGDYVVYVEKKDIVRFRKVVSKNGALVTLKNPNSKDDEVTIDRKDIIAVSTYHSDFLSLLLTWLTEPVVVIAIFVVAVLLPEVQYRDYD